MQNKKRYLGVILGFMFITMLSLVAVSVHANPLQFKPAVATSAASTTVSYMQTGRATTTLVYDSYAAGQPYATDKATLFLSFTGSSTASVLNTDIEYSQDNIDWYQDGGTMQENFSTSSKPMDISQVSQFKWTFASSTAGLPANPASNATATRALLLKTPTRYMRAVFSMPAGSASGAIWAQFIPARQSSQ